MCVENDDLSTLRKVYSLVALIVQYVLPIVIVCSAHTRISRKLKYRLQLRQQPSLMQQVAMQQISGGEGGVEPKRPVFKVNQQQSCGAKARRINTGGRGHGFERFSMKNRKGKTEKCRVEEVRTDQKKTTFFQGRNLDESIVEKLGNVEQNSDRNQREGVGQGEQKQNWNADQNMQVQQQQQQQRVNVDHLDQKQSDKDKMGDTGVMFYARKRRREDRRRRRTNRLLVLIAVVFAASWAPLNIANVVNDFNLALVKTFNDSFADLLFPVCHLLVLCSACINPVLYGWLNDNFRQEFVRILKSGVRCVVGVGRCCGCGRRQRGRRCSDGDDLRSSASTTAGAGGENGMSQTFDYMCKTSVFDGGIVSEENTINQQVPDNCTNNSACLY